MIDTCDKMLAVLINRRAEHGRNAIQFYRDGSTYDAAVADGRFCELNAIIHLMGEPTISIGEFEKEEAA